jgi:hypothetical protein
MILFIYIKIIRLTGAQDQEEKERQEVANIIMSASEFRHCAMAVQWISILKTSVSVLILLRRRRRLHAPSDIEMTVRPIPFMSAVIVQSSHAQRIKDGTEMTECMQP